MVGQSNLAGDQISQPFLWKHGHMLELLAAGIRLRRRRRIRAAAAAAAAAVVVAAIPVGLGAFGHFLRPSPPIQRAAGPTLYIYAYRYTGSLGGTVTPISTATGTPGKPIHIWRGRLDGTALGQIAITPDGKTAYVTGPDTVTPISTATGTPGTPIRVPGGIRGIAITPDGKTAYVTTRNGVTPISTATNAPGTPIPIARAQCYGQTGFAENIAITPDGKTAYVLDQKGTVTPIDTATNTPGTPIPGGLFDLGAGQIAITPDGKTAYATTRQFCHSQTCHVRVIPISTATNTPGKPINFAANVTRGGTFGQIAITPDGKTAYITTGSTVTPISTATGTPGTPIPVGPSHLSCWPPPGGPRCLWGGQIVITPDGKTAYVTNGLGVTPISTATNTPGTPIRVPGSKFEAIAITP